MAMERFQILPEPEVGEHGGEAGVVDQEEDGVVVQETVGGE